MKKKIITIAVIIIVSVVLSFCSKDDFDELMNMESALSNASGTILSISPTNNETDVDTHTNITIVFDYSMDTSTNPPVFITINNEAKQTSLASYTWTKTNSDNDTLIINFSWHSFPMNSIVSWRLSAVNLKYEGGKIFTSSIEGTFTTGCTQVYSASDTGVTKCYDNSSEIVCPNEGESFYGQDGNFTGIPHSRSFTDNGDGTITDNTIGLTWKKCVEGLSGSDCLDGAQYEYSWYNAKSICDPLNSENNGLGYGNRIDWRLPSINEYQTIVDFTRKDPAIDPIYFPNTPYDDYYFSSTERAYNFAQYAWIVNFQYGITGNSNKSNKYYVRCVSGP